MSSLYAVGSGLDIPTIVSQLVAAERAPTENRINKQGTAATAQLSALGTIKSALGNLQSSLKSVSESISTPTWKTTVAEGAGFTASSNSSATAGSYDIKVETLAKAQKLRSAAFAADEKVGAGSLDISIGQGDNAKTFQIDVADDMSLASLAREINRVVDGKGLTASVITSDEGQHLVLTATGTGEDGRISIAANPAAVAEPGEGEGEAAAPAANRLDALASASMTEVVPPSQAKVIIDGIERTSSSNTFTDLVEGMTITLTKENAEQSHTLTVAADTTLAKTNLQAFVATYNATLNALKSSSSYNKDTNTASALTGDSMVRGLQNQLRAIIGGENITELKALGLSVAKDGILSFDSGTFDKARADQPSLAESVLGKTGRIADRLGSLLTNNLDSDKGLLTKRTDTLNQQIKKLEKDLDNLDARMLRVQERYTKQFTAMDSLVASMQSTSNYLTQQLASLSSQTSKG